MAASISRVVWRMSSTSGSVFLSQGTNCVKGVPALPIPGLPTQNWVNISSMVLAEITASGTSVRTAWRSSLQSNTDTFVMTFTAVSSQEASAISAYLSQRRGEIWSINISRYNVNQIP